MHAYGKLNVYAQPEHLRGFLVKIHRGCTKPDNPAMDAGRYHRSTWKAGQAIVGVELLITRIEGKWKVSQNQPPRTAWAPPKGWTPWRA